MPANQKPIYASDYTTHGGRLFAPGQRMDNVGLPDHALKGAIDGGVATDSSTVAEKARNAEKERRAHVAEQIENRSEKRDRGEQRNIPNLVRLPDGTYAQVSE